MVTKRQFTEVEKRRLANVRTLSSRFFSNKQLGEALGLTKSGISQLIGNNPVRPISERAARRWEKRLSLPDGSLDQNPQLPSPAPEANVQLLKAVPVQQPEDAKVTLLDTVMRDVDAAVMRTGVQLSPEKYRACVTFFYRWAMNHGYQSDLSEADNLVRLLG